MPNITISIPEALYKKMKKYSEVKWSEVVRKALTEYVRRLEVLERGFLSSDELAELLRESDLDVSSISLEKAIKHYEKARELEWKRSSTTRVRS
jgi:metal-responsive CopG/Arc/MetJ family transcriptional regulator